MTEVGRYSPSLDIVVFVSYNEFLLTILLIFIDPVAPRSENKNLSVSSVIKLGSLFSHGDQGELNEECELQKAKDFCRSYP